jgi:uncharacterized protein YcbK (DUF882 family)
LSRHKLILAVASVAAVAAAAGPAAPVAGQPGERTLSIHNIHTKETVTAVFKRGGRYEPEGLAKLSHVMRDHRRNEATRMDPALLDLLWEIHHELGSREPIHLISGYRSRATNDMLRRTSGGQASESRHILGKAADVHFPDVPIRKLRYSALLQERGGVGYYPTSALPFVHVDTDRVRSWPRLPRHELALLFPDGSTRHAPADGGPISKADVQIARVKHQDLAKQVGQFHRERGRGDARIAALAEQERPQRPVLSAGIVPAPASLAEIPPALRGAVIPALSRDDRARLAELAGLASLPVLVSGPAPARRPQARLASLGEVPLPAAAASIGSGAAMARDGIRLAALIQETTPPGAAGDTREPGRAVGGASGDWAPAPAFDEEHPEELSYRPFPIAPYMTGTASEPLMHELVSHDVARTLEILDHPDTGAILRFRPSASAASLLWSQQFTGAAIGIDRLKEAQAADAGPAGPRDLRRRPVRTTRN